jgi:hypothetical protein
MGLLNSFYYVGQILASGLAVPLGRKAGNVSELRRPAQLTPSSPVVKCSPRLLADCLENPAWYPTGIPHH